MNKILSACALALAMLVPAISASAQTVNMIATLTGAEENPPTLTGAVASADFAVDTDNREIQVNLRIFNIPTGTTAGHIHAGPRGVNGPVVLNFPIPVGRSGDITLSFRVGGTTGVFIPRPEVGINTIDDIIQTIVGGGAYANIHTTAFPGGEIRGQIRFPGTSP
jgi:CHRD domain-containing protein